MATIDYKEKYEQALERAKKAVDDGMVSQNFVEDIFYEHKESEGERIKEQIIWDRIKQMYNNMDDAAKSQVERAFPELAESEDERISKELIEFLKGSHYLPAKMGRWLAWLEKQGEKSAEWSEEDENIFRDIVTRLHSHPDVDKTEYDKSYHWLKDLKDRYIWKPSDRQMEALWNVYQGGKEQAELAILYNDLKKLRNE